MQLVMYQQWGRDDDKKIDNAIYIYINVVRARTQYTRNTNVLCIVLVL